MNSVVAHFVSSELTFSKGLNTNISVISLVSAFWLDLSLNLKQNHSQGESKMNTVTEDCQLSMWMFLDVYSIIICEFAHLLRSTHNPQINTSSVLITMGMAENLSPPTILR